jgi:hypothetical protein
MSFPRIRFIKAFLVVLALLFSLIFISFIFVSEVTLPRKVRSYIEEISRDKGYKIEIKDIEFDLFSGLKGKDIEISDPISLVKPILKVGEIAIKPEILPSLLSWKIKVRGIIVDKPVLSLTKEELDNLMKLIEEEEDKKEKSFLIEIEHLEIRNAKVEVVPGVLLSSQKIEFNFEDARLKEEKTIKLSGSVNLLDNDIEIQGKINPFLDTPTGELRVKLTELNMGSLSTAFKPRVRLAIFSDLQFQVSDNITSQGVINFVPSKADGEKNSVFSGKLYYDLTYNRLSDTAFINSLNLNVNELARISFAGSIEKAKTEGIFNLQGEAEDIQLENIPNWVPNLSSIDLSGDVKTSNIRVTGSRENKNISLSGNATLSEVDIKDKKDDFQIKGLEGRFDFKKAFGNETYGGLSTHGDFSLERISAKIGELSGVSGKVEFTADNDGSNKTINLSSLKASFLDGQVSGNIEFRVLNEKTTLKANLEGSNLDLKEIPKDYIPTPLEGKVEAINAEFMSENMKEFNADLSFSLRGFRVEAGENGTIKASKAKSIRPLGVKFFKLGNRGAEEGHLGESQNSDARQTSERRQNKMAIENKGLYYENLSFNEFSVKKGNASELLFELLENNNWVFNISSTGSQFQIDGEDVYLKKLRTNVHAEKNGKVSVWGNLDGKGGSYGKFSLPSLSTDFKFSNNLLELTNLKTQVGSYGELKTKELKILLGDKIYGAPHKLTFTQGTFSGFNKRVKSEEIRGEFVLHTGTKKPRWSGNIFIHETDIISQKLKNLSLRIESSQHGMNLEKISGSFLGGNLKGRVFVKITQTPNLIQSQIELERASIPLNNLNLSLGELDFSFKGSLQKSFLPKGKGEINFSNLTIGSGKKFSSVRGKLQIETFGETIIFKNRFIEDGEGVGITLNARIENPLNGNRSLKLNLPLTPLASIQRILSPALPDILRNGEFKGVVSLDLVSNHFLNKETSINGNLSIKDVSFSGKFNGTHFLINDINGYVPIRDKINPGVSLASLMRNSEGHELNKKVFKNFLDLVNSDNTRNGEDFLMIKEIEYGFLRLENIECEIELNRDRINLRRLEPKLYKGHVFGTVQLDFGEGKYNFSFLFKKISLKSISNSIPSTKDYITGRINGITWISGEGNKLNKLDGAFNFWAIESKEPRRIGKAFLQKLGVKEKFFLRSSRKYDKGELYGYIKDGVITFKKLEISHRIFGIIEDLSIRVDPKRNSISVAHFLSVMRETAKRASKGELKIEYEKNK